MRTADVIDTILKPEYERFGYAFFEDENFDLNLFGIRHPDYNNLFNDILGCAYRSDGQWSLRLWKGTTDPGGYYLRQPAHSGGTAIVVPGQYRGLWKIGKHQGKYEALTQQGAKVAVYRDADKDQVLDLIEATIDTGYFGINQHKAGRSSTQVDRWSAGCQVHAVEANFDELMWLAHMQLKLHPSWDSFTYTLFTLMDDPAQQTSPDLEILFDLEPGWLERHPHPQRMWKSGR
jgi:hypothetical protein